MGERPELPWDDCGIKTTKGRTRRHGFGAQNCPKRLGQAVRSRATKQVARPPLVGLVIEA
jgi:hypothetical protein